MKVQEFHSGIQWGIHNKEDSQRNELLSVKHKLKFFISSISWLQTNKWVCDYKFSRCFARFKSIAFRGKALWLLEHLPRYGNKKWNIKLKKDYEMFKVVSWLCPFIHFLVARIKNRKQCFHFNYSAGATNALVFTLHKRT